MNTEINRTWIAAEFSKGIDAEHSSATNSHTRAASTEDPALRAIYNEMAEADEKHGKVVELVAIRYGHTPSRNASGGIGEVLGHLKDRVAEMGSNPMTRVSGDLGIKANAIHWYNAWIQAFKAIGDEQSASELAGVLVEETTHHEALQKCLNSLVEQGAIGVEPKAVIKT